MQKRISTTVSRTASVFLVVVVCQWAVSSEALAAGAAKNRTRERVVKKLPIAGEAFKVNGRTAFIIMPKKTIPTGPMPWVWYAPTLPGLPDEIEKWMHQKFLDAGIAVAGIDVGESYGSPAGVKHYAALYKKLTTGRGFSKKPCLLARSRGGLMLYNWAVENPKSVGCIAGIYPVCNIASYPGLRAACGAYGLNEQQLGRQLKKYNPIDRLAPLAKAGVPIFHIHGDNDNVVPLDKNSGEDARRYKKLGGKMTLLIARGQGHSGWQGFFRCKELIKFVIAHAKEQPKAKAKKK
jgi:pimeloyl-ACP methyl ester carboxylesterase